MYVDTGAVVIESFAEHVPVLHPSAWVHRAGHVIGQVTLGEQSSVWPTAVLRGDVGAIVVGARTNIQDGAICHDTTGISETILGDEITVGHRAILHGCRVEDRCLIGMGAIVLDNVSVGTGSLIGAGSLVLAGTVIPPHSVVVGSPARVIRKASGRVADMIEEGWKTYVDKVAVWRRSEDPR